MPLIDEEELEEIRADGANSPVYVALMEDLFRREREFVNQMEAVFADVTLGDGIGLYEGEARDMCTNPMIPWAARQRDERDSWKALSLEDLNLNYSSLIFTDAEGFRFLIPAYMLANLGEGDDDYALRHLALARNPGDGRFRLLGFGQVQSIVEFLRIYYELPYEIFEKEAIRAALNTCWLPLLHQLDDGAEEVNNRPA